MSKDTSNETTLCIVGAGMAGLSAGIYGQLNGFTTRIYEKHSLPGGLCTAWQRRWQRPSSFPTPSPTRGNCWIAAALPWKAQWR